MHFLEPLHILHHVLNNLSLKYGGALRAPLFRRFAPVAFFKYDGALRAPRLRRFTPVKALRACGRHGQVLDHYLHLELTLTLRRYTKLGSAIFISFI